MAFIGSWNAAAQTPSAAIKPLTPMLHGDLDVLLIPNDAPERDSEWLNRWDQEIPNCRRLDLGSWDNPHRNTWVNKINLAIYRAGRPVVLVAHGLGCVAAAWWAEYESPAFGDRVVAALMVAPPDVDRPGADARLARFSSCPRQLLPFVSMLVADHYGSKIARSTLCRLARDWGSSFIAVEDLTPRGDWVSGRELLGRVGRSHNRDDALVPIGGRQEATAQAA